MSPNMAWVGRATRKAGTYFRWDFYLGVEVKWTVDFFWEGGGGTSITMGKVHRFGGQTSGESSLAWLGTPLPLD